MNLMPRHATGRARAQQGFTLIGLIFWAVVISMLALLVMKVAPALSEYRTIQGMVNKAAREGGSTVPEIRAAYDRYLQIEYGVEAIRSGRDLDVAKEDAESELLIMVRPGLFERLIRRRQTGLLLRLLLKEAFCIDPRLVLDDLLDVDGIEDVLGYEVR